MALFTKPFVAASLRRKVAGSVPVLVIVTLPMTESPGLRFESEKIAAFALLLLCVSVPEA